MTLRPPIKIDYPGWTAIPNVLFESLPTISEAELKVAMVIIRETQGWHKKEITISLSEIAKLCGLSKGSCCDAAKGLVEMGAIKKEANHGTDGERSASTYKINFSEPTPPFAQPNTPPPDSEIQHTPHSEIQNAIRNKEIHQDKKEEYTPPTPSENYTHRDLINHLNSEGGLIGRGGRTAIERIDLTDLTFEQAVAKARVEAERPSRTSRKTTGPTRPSRHESMQRPSPVPEADVTPLDRDYPGEWNRIVLAAKIEWCPERGSMAALRQCAADPVFRDRFEEVCKIAQQCHLARPDSTWMTFEWLLFDNGKGFGWWRLLTGLKWMSEPPSTTKKGNVFDEIKRRGLLKK